MSSLHRTSEPGDSVLASMADTLGQHNKLPVLTQTCRARSVAHRTIKGRTVSLLLSRVPKPTDSVPRKGSGIPPRTEAPGLPAARPVNGGSPTQRLSPARAASGVALEPAIAKVRILHAHFAATPGFMTQVGVAASRIRRRDARKRVTAPIGRRVGRYCDHVIVMSCELFSTAPPILPRNAVKVCVPLA